jgi:predicted small metal-binding protein
VAIVYVIACESLGVDCSFSAKGANHEEVIERCADHGRTEHNMRSFSQDLYAKMRAAIKAVEEEVRP